MEGKGGGEGGEGIAPNKIPRFREFFSLCADLPPWWGR